jgi:hypothetical protein
MDSARRQELRRKAENLRHVIGKQIVTASKLLHGDCCWILSICFLQAPLTIFPHRHELNPHTYTRSLVRTVASVETSSSPTVKLSSTVAPLASGVIISR